jgi:hypothetical protein
MNGIDKSGLFSTFSKLEATDCNYVPKIEASDELGV